MTIATLVNRIAYNGDGVTLTFPYTFQILLSSDLQIYDIVNATGVATLQTLGVNYSVSGAGAPSGGNVTMVAAPAVGHTLLIIRVEPQTQASQLPSNDKFPTITVETALDKLTMLVQQLSEVDSRCVKLPITSLFSNLIVPDPVASKLLRWRTDLLGLENADVVAQGVVVLPLAINQGGTGAITASAALTAIGGVDKTVVTTKGDLLAATAASTLVRKGAGADGHELLSDSSQADGLLWSIGRIPEHGRLVRASATQLAFNPFKGTKLPVVTSGVFRLRDIGSGITSASPVAASNFVNGLASQTLTANTTYLVTVFDNAGTLTFDFLTTLTHAPDATTGVEIKNGDNTRTVVGMIRTNATPNFEDDNALRGVLSYFNRRDIGLVASFTADRSTASATYVEINSEIRGNFLTWADEAVVVATNGSVNNSGVATNFTAIGFDGTNQENAVAVGTSAVAAYDTPPSISLVKNGLAEGFHYVTMLGAVSGNTGTWNGGAYAADTTRRAICSLTVRIRG